VLNAIGVKAKALTLPGGYIIYNRSWPDPDVVRNANIGIRGFLTSWVGVTNPPKP
jgi:hypothetical protein